MFAGNQTACSHVDAPWVLYVLECVNGAWYAGITNDLQKRFTAHQAGKGAKYTRANPPLRILGWASFNDRSLASKAEYRIKQLPKSKKLDFLQSLQQQYSPLVQPESLMTETSTIRLTFDVSINLTDISQEGRAAALADIKQNLEALANLAINEGLVTKSLDAIIEDYAYKAFEVESVDEDAVAEYLTQRVEDGDLNPEDLIVQAVRYGLQEPAQFAAEMNERMQSMQTERSYPVPR